MQQQRALGTAMAMEQANLVAQMRRLEAKHSVAETAQSRKEWETQGRKEFLLEMATEQTRSEAESALLAENSVAESVQAGENVSVAAL